VTRSGSSANSKSPLAGAYGAVQYPPFHSGGWASTSLIGSQAMAYSPGPSRSCGAGVRDAHAEVLELAQRIKAPVGYTLRGKEWIEHDNPYAVGLTGLIGFGGLTKALHDADLLLMVGTDFPYRT
jgi:Thiamine pyrophosphate enzyme, central domain